MKILDILFENSFEDPYSIRQYLEGKGKNQRTINKVLKIYNSIENDLKNLNKEIDETLIDELTGYVEKGEGYKYKNLIKKKAEKRNEQPVKKEVQQIVPKKRGRKRSFESNLTFPKQGKKGRKKKKEPKKGNPGNKKKEINPIYNLQDYNNFVAQYPGKKILPFDMLESLKNKFKDTPVVLVFEANGRGPYFVYTSKNYKFFFTYGVNAQGRSGTATIRTIPVDEIKKKINNEENVGSFMKDLGPENLKNLSYNNFLKQYYKSNNFFDLDKNRIFINDWSLILNDIVNKFGFKVLSPVALSENEFNEFKKKYLPLSKEEFSSALKNLAVTKGWTLREYLENYGKLLNEENKIYKNVFNNKRINEKKEVFKKFKKQGKKRTEEEQTKKEIENFFRELKNNMFRKVISEGPDHRMIKMEDGSTILEKINPDTGEIIEKLKITI